MNPFYPKIIFLGGSIKRASVRIRCMQIAEALGCDYMCNVNSIQNIKPTKRVFICIKPELSEDELCELSNRGIVIWDIQDEPPPIKNIYAYIASSKETIKNMPYKNKTYIIPQHHCNFTGFPNSPNLNRKPTWIGRPFWYPKIKEVEVDMYNSNILGLEEIISIYRNTGLILNMRRPCIERNNHIKLNDGGKLINSMAFGIPSISEKEPAYIEYGEDCTIFADLNDFPNYIKKLQCDDKLYLELRSNGIEKAKEFHINRIVLLYKKIFEELLEYS